MNDANARPIVFTPDNEPYLGLTSVFALDVTISACLDLSGKVAPTTHEMEKSDLQEAACQLVPQAINLTLAVRELVRQGYLFGALILLRSLIERVAILRYIISSPEGIDLWKRGWNHKEAPCLAKMLGAMQKEGKLKSDAVSEAALKVLYLLAQDEPTFDIIEITGPLNDAVHGKPASAVWTVVPVGGDRFGHAPSKILNNPLLCDRICLPALAMLLVLQTTIAEVFPQSTPTLVGHLQ